MLNSHDPSLIYLIYVLSVCFARFTEFKPVTETWNLRSSEIKQRRLQAWKVFPLFQNLEQSLSEMKVQATKKVTVKCLIDGLKCLKKKRKTNKWKEFYDLDLYEPCYQPIHQRHKLCWGLRSRRC